MQERRKHNRYVSYDRRKSTTDSLMATAIGVAEVILVERAVESIVDLLFGSSSSSDDSSSSDMSGGGGTFDGGGASGDW